VPTQADVRKICLALPEVTENEDSFGFRVAGKPFVWAYLERIDPKKGRVPTTDRIGVRTLNEAVKFALINENPKAFFTEAHYNGYPAVCVHLGQVTTQELSEVINDAWRVQAPKKLLKRMDE
jgi:hypothetical protein